MIDVNDSFIPIRIEVISPVHIGSGVHLSPLDLKVVQEEDGYWCYTVDYQGYLTSLSVDESLDLANFFSKSDQKQVWERLKNDIPKDIYALTKSKTSKEIYDKYNERLRTDKSNNELASGLRNPLTHALLIVGSSLKGSIRTALLDHMDKGELKKAYGEGKSKGYEEQVQKWFGKISDNAFEALKISDFEFLQGESEFVIPKEIKKKNNNSSPASFKDPCEVVPHYAKPKYGRLIMGRFSNASNYKTPLPDWTFESLKKVCNAFYRKRFNEDFERFYKLPGFESVRRFVEEELAAKIKSSPDAILLRVGHYSHIDCMTVTNNAPETKKIDGKDVYNTARTLANSSYPFGWVLLHKCEQSEYKQGVLDFEEEQKAISKRYLSARRSEEQRISKLREEEEKNKQEQLEQKRLAEEKRERERIALEAKKAEEERLKAEEKEKKAQKEADKLAEAQRLESLSPVEKAIELTLKKQANAEQLVLAYTNIDNELVKDKKAFAEALRAGLQKEGLWNVNKKTKKNKVDEINKRREALQALLAD